MSGDRGRGHWTPEPYSSIITPKWVWSDVFLLYNNKEGSNLTFSLIHHYAQSTVHLIEQPQDRCNKPLYGLRLECKSFDNYISLINPAWLAVRNPWGFNFEGSLTTMPYHNCRFQCGRTPLTTNRHVRWDHFQTGYNLTTICYIYCNKLFPPLLSSAKKKQLKCLMDLAASCSYCTQSQ